MFTSKNNSPELDTELRDLGNRDLQLWSMGALVMTVVASGFLGLVAPNLLWKEGAVKVESHYLPQLFTGFIVLVVLFNIYLVNQKRRLNVMRDGLVRRMLLTDSGEKSSSRDHLTGAFNREYALFAIERERKRLDRAPFTALMIDVADFRKVNHRFGSLAGDHLLLVAAQLIRSTFRGSDVVCRFGGDEFVVVMPETTAEQCAPAIARLTQASERWNHTTNFHYSLSFRTAQVAGSASTNAEAMIEELFVRTRGERQLPMLIALPHAQPEAIQA
jgi:diguanylate cyclase (GGDEF)-like protein